MAPSRYTATDNSTTFCNKGAFYPPLPRERLLGTRVQYSRIIGVENHRFSTYTRLTGAPSHSIKRSWFTLAPKSNRKSSNYFTLPFPYPTAILQGLASRDLTGLVRARNRASRDAKFQSQWLGHGSVCGLHTTKPSQRSPKSSFRIRRGPKSYLCRTEKNFVIASIMIRLCATRTRYSTIIGDARVCFFRILPSYPRRGITTSL